VIRNDAKWAHRPPCPRLMDYFTCMRRINKDAGVARNVFDMGLKQHGSEVNYVLSYVDFLMTLNDDNNTRY
jgi:hypothetical protein